MSNLTNHENTGKVNGQPSVPAWESRSPLERIEILRGTAARSEVGVVALLKLGALFGFVWNDVTQAWQVAQPIAKPIEPTKGADDESIL